MLKLPSNGMKKGMSILLAAFFVVSLTAVAASAHHGGYGGRGGYGGWGYDDWGYGGCGGWGYGGWGSLGGYGCCNGYGFYGCGCGWGGYPWDIATLMAVGATTNQLILYYK